MFSRIAGVVVLTGAIVLGSMGLGRAESPSTTTIGGIKPPPSAVPEFDPDPLGSAIVILAGGLFLLNEHRRKTC